MVFVPGAVVFYPCLAAEDDGEGNQGAGGHEDGGGERVHVAGEAEEDSGGVVGDGEGEDAADGAAAGGGGVEEAADAGEAAAPAGAFHLNAEIPPRYRDLATTAKSARLTAPPGHVVFAPHHERRP